MMHGQKNIKKTTGMYLSLLDYGHGCYDTVSYTETYFLIYIG